MTCTNHNYETRIAELEQENASLYALLADIRHACGDNGTRMQGDLVTYIKEIYQERDALKAHCADLRSCLELQKYNDGRGEKCLGKTLAITPRRSLAEIQINAIEDAANNAIEKFSSTHHPITVANVIDAFRQYANDLHKQACRERKVDEAFAVIVKGGRNE
jgi:hypothetical protein